MVLLTIVKSKLEEELEEVHIICEKHNVIGLAKSSNFNRSKGDSKARVLGSLDLFIIITNI